MCRVDLAFAVVLTSLVRADAERALRASHRHAATRIAGTQSLTCQLSSNSRRHRADGGQGH